MNSPTVIDDVIYSYAHPHQLVKLDAVKKHGSVKAAARALGLHHSSINETIKSIKKRAALQGYSPAHDMTHTVPQGFAVKGVSTYYGEDGKPRGQWVKSTRDQAQAEQVMRDFIESLTHDIKGKAPAVKPPAYSNADLLCVYPLGDPHFGLYAWGAETGDDFDSSIAESLTTSAINRLVDSAPEAETAIVLPLGDFFHADDSTARTPGSGHQLDVDTRWPKVMQIGLRALVHCVQRALSKHKKVVVRVVRGNHDHHASFGLALALDAYFHNEKRVHVDLHPAPFWYYRHGKVLIGSTHGDQAKPADMPAIMAFDKPEDWGQTKHRYWYLGHVHHQTQKEHPGVIVEQFRTLAARDAWHAGMGYRAGRDMCLIVHHKDHGEIERHRCDVGMLC